MKTIKSSKYNILLMLLIIGQLCYTTYVFVYQREGAHADELWCYGFANSYYCPYLNAPDADWVSDIKVEDYININEWLPGEMFHDYITVQPEERFSYDSVYHNMSTDCHPPLYSMLLHTVCSFFPDTFSYYYAFFLNCLFLIGTQIYLYLLAHKVSGSPETALLVCLLYGGGVGALSTFLFLRQYSLLTMLVTAYTYYCVMLSHAAERYAKYLAGAALTAFLAFMSHYYAIAYIGVFTALQCIKMLADRHWRRMLLYGFCILAALGTMIAVYPAFLTLLFAPNDHVIKYFPEITQIRIMLNYWAVSCMGFRVAIFGTIFWNIFPHIVGMILLVIGLALFLCRKEPWLPEVIAKVKSAPGRLCAFVKKADYTAVIILLSAFSIYPFVSKISNVVVRGDVIIRYVFLTFPLLSCAIVSLAYMLLCRISRVKKYSRFILLVCVIGILVRVQLTAPCYFLFQHFGDYQDVSELVEDKNVVTITSTKISYHWMFPCFSPYVCTADKVFCTSAQELPNVVEDITSMGKDIDYVLITAQDLALRQEELELFLSWFDNATYEPEEKSKDSEEGSKEPENADSGRLSCAELIRSFNGGCDYDLLFGINIQGAPVYVLKLHEAARTDV